MAEYVERGKITELAIAALNDYKRSEKDWIMEVSTDIYNDLSDVEEEVKARIEEITSIPPADVRPVGEISNAVDAAIDYLNRASLDMPHCVYYALYDLICGICPNWGADNREEHQ